MFTKLEKNSESVYDGIQIWHTHDIVGMTLKIFESVSSQETWSNINFLWPMFNTEHI